MRKFLVRLFIFSIPVFLILLLPLYVLWKNEENFYKIDKLITSKEKYLVGYGYNEYNYRYLKWAHLKNNPAKTIWALGASRVLEFRDRMFDSSFYNAGFTVNSINDYLPFLQSIPAEKYPRYLLLSLDHMMFNEACDSLRLTPPVSFWQSSFRLYPRLGVYQAAFKDVFSGKYPVISFNKKDAMTRIGLNAEVNNTGFRNDGSMHYGAQIPKLLSNDTTADDYNYTNTLERIRKGNMRFEYGKTVNEKALLELDTLLGYCRNNHIEIIAFLPPFSDKVYSSMINSGHYPYLDSLFAKIKAVHDKYGFEFYDFSNMSKCNSNDTETIDGMHGSEATYIKLLIKMLESGSRLKQVTSLQKLQQDEARKLNRYEVYSY